MTAALPVMVAGYEEDWSNFSEHPGARPVFGLGANFITVNGKRSFWLFTIARWACIPFSIFGGLFCFFWSRELWGNNLAGLISLTLWCFSPNILAHGELIATDCAATSFGVGATFFFWRWLKQPTYKRAIAAGLLLGLAQLSKMTWVILFGLWPLLWLFWIRKQFFIPHVTNCVKGSLFYNLSTQLIQLSTILLIALWLLNLGYAFDGTMTQLKDFTFISTRLNGGEESGNHGNRFANSWIGEIPVPFPKQYVMGIDVQQHDFEDFGRPSYLRGTWKDGGWWYYYLYGLAVKTPLGTLVLLLLSTILVSIQLFQHQIKHFPSAQDIAILLIPAILVLIMVSAHLEFNHHLRYVLPVHGFAFIFIGAVSFIFYPSESR